MNSKDLEERLIEFAVTIIRLSDEIASTKAGNHLASQLVRSGTSPALNYGEAQSGESRKDFIHKLKIVLKELRETHICLRIISKANLYEKTDVITEVIQENNELIAIFAKSIETAEKRSVKGIY